MKIKEIIKEYYTPTKDGIVSGLMGYKITHNIENIYVACILGIVISVAIVSLLTYLNKIISDS